ncbi:MAG: hypothetical protein GY722_20490, partial [bacterium]|nr:hypothetical protein [bacterium]
GEGVREASVDSAGAAAGLVEVSFLEVVSSDEFNDVLTVREGRKRNEEPETLWGQHDSTQGA